jgi:hypothetical protein
MPKYSLNSEADIEMIKSAAILALLNSTFPSKAASTC